MQSKNNQKTNEPIFIVHINVCYEDKENGL